ncbi:MAG TPA: LPS assembly protein LptD [Thermoanaerobaculia bacterium]|jgi:LPS-assembly protein|nr:LPS assembly protein LptD [Thermoanaerobaculia bacterium]
MRLRTLLILALTAVPVFAQKPSNFKFMPGPKPGGGEVKVTVAEGGVTEIQKDEYSISQGGVTIEYQDIKLVAYKVTYNYRTKDVVAEGNVIIDQGPTRITATQAMYNLNSKTGTFFNATGTMDPAMYFSGDRIEKVDEDTYRLTNGVFTSCDLDRPAWSFHIGDADVTLDDYAHMRNVSFRARNLPIFWTPRLIWPTKRDRSKGFLIPRAKFTDEFGTRVETGYFLPIGESWDATLYADVSTENYFGGGLEMRYVPSENVKLGDFRARFVNNAPEKRIEWKYEFRHAQENLPGGFRGVVDVQDYSRLDFFREYDDDTRVLTLSNIYSSAYLTKNRPKYSLNVLADRRDYELLQPAPEQVPGEPTRFVTARQRYEQLPSLQYRMFPQRIGRTPFYYSMESSSSRLRTGGVDPQGARTIDADYYRTDIFPTLSMRLRTPQWFSVKPQLAVRNTVYSASQQLVCDGPEPPIECAACEANPNLAVCTRRELRDDEGVTRFYAQGQVEVVGPSLSKVFNRSAGGFSRFKHVIEPRVRYVYTTNVENQEEIARFDTIDTPFLPIVRDSVEYSLTQRLIGKEAAAAGGNPREVLSFALRQSVALSDPFPRFTGTTRSEHQFTPLVATLRFNPYQSVTLDANASFGNVSRQADSMSLSANLVGTGDRADKYLGFTYYASFDTPGLDNGRSQIRLNGGSYLVKDRIRADVQLNFDATEGRFLDQRYLTGWLGSCYGLAVEYRRYEVFSGAEGLKNVSSYGIAVTLKNVGTIGSH